MRADNLEAVGALGQVGAEVLKALVVPPLLPLLQVHPHLCRKVDVRLPGKGNSNPHGARPVHLIITMIKWIRTSRLSIKNSLTVLKALVVPPLLALLQAHPHLPYRSL